MIIRIWDNTTNQIVVFYPNLKDIPLTPDNEKRLCDYVWKDAVNSKLVTEGEKEGYWFELKKHPTKQKINS